MTERSRSQGRGKENCFSPSLAEPVEATTQLNPFGKNILKHTLHQFASEFPLCFLNNIVLSLKFMCFKNNSDS